MRLLRSAAFISVALGLAGSLLADSIDPGVLFSRGGNHSAVINCTTNGCVTDVGTVDQNGGAQFDVRNGTNKDIIELLFTIPTDNFDQIFFANSNLFLMAEFPNPGKDLVLEVLFSGTGNGPDGTVTIPPPVNTCAPPCAPGFAPGGEITVSSIFGTSNGGDHPGLLAGQEGVLTLDPTMPEPGTFVLFVSVLAFLVFLRKSYARRISG